MRSGGNNEVKHSRRDDFWTDNDSVKQTTLEKLIEWKYFISKDLKYTQQKWNFLPFGNVFQY